MLPPNIKVTERNMQDHAAAAPLFRVVRFSNGKTMDADPLWAQTWFQKSVRGVLKIVPKNQWRIDPSNTLAPFCQPSWTTRSRAVARNVGSIKLAAEAWARSRRCAFVRSWRMECYEQVMKPLCGGVLRLRRRLASGSGATHTHALYGL